MQIPPAVYRELYAKSGPESARLDSAIADFIQQSPAPALADEVARQVHGVGPGEQQAIALASEAGSLLLMDEGTGSPIA